METWVAYQPQIFLSIGVVLIIIESMVLGMSTGILLIAGVGAILTAAVTQFVFIPDTFASILATYALSTVASALIVWPILKRLNRNIDTSQVNQSDFVGQTLILDSALSTAEPIHQQFSGVDWQVYLQADSSDTEVPTGSRVTIVSAEVGRLFVKPEA